MNFLRKRSQIPPPPGADHGHVLGQRFFRENSKRRMKLTPVCQVKKVILGQHKLISTKNKFYKLLATLQLNCMKIRLQVLTTATTILQDL